MCVQSKNDILGFLIRTRFLKEMLLCSGITGLKTLPGPSLGYSLKPL